MKKHTEPLMAMLDALKRKRREAVTAIAKARRERMRISEAFKTGQIACRTDRAILDVRKAAKRDRCSQVTVDRANRLISKLPARIARGKKRSLSRAAVGIQRACRANKLGRIPKDARRVVRALESASGFEFAYPTVDPDDFLEYLSTYLPKRGLERIAKMPHRRWVLEGLAALVRASRARSWIDLESKRFRGAESVLAIARGYPGLARIRLPDRAYELAAWSPEGVPF